MADTQSKIRDFLIAEARRHPRRFLKGPRRVPNSSTLADAMGVSQATVWRILHLRRNVRSAEERRRGLPDFAVSAELEAGLLKLSGLHSRAELWEAIENAPPAPPLPKRPRPKRPSRPQPRGE